MKVRTTAEEFEEERVMKRRDQVKEINKASAEELTKRVNELGHELMNLRFRKKSSQLTSSSRITEVKREIARAKTQMVAVAKTA